MRAFIPSAICICLVSSCSSSQSTTWNDAGSLSDANADSGASGDARACTNAPPGTTVELINSVPATGTALGVDAYHVTYSSPDGLRVHGQICVPKGPGPYPLIVFNHGGIAGLGPSDWSAVGPGTNANQCYSLASSGFIASMSQYRGEGDVLGGALGTIQSEGKLEFCAGEVDDSLALLEIARARCDADPTRVVMWGVSHGGCITLQAARRHVPGLRAAVALVPPTDLPALYKYHIDRIPGGPGPADACDAVSTHKYLTDAIKAAIGTPESNPTAYAARSVSAFAADYASVPVMMMWGLDDCTVPFSQACTMHQALDSAGVSQESYHLDAAGNATTSSVAGCSAFAPLKSGAWPGTTGFTGERYAIAFDGEGHGFAGVSAPRALEALLAFFASHLK